MRKLWTLSTTLNISPVRRIIYLKEGIQYKRCLKELWHFGIRPLKYLSQLGMVVGEDLSMNGFSAHPDVQYMEPDIRITIMEPYVGHIQTAKTLLPWGIKRIQAERAWRISQGKGIRVAVIDTGIYSEHPAIKENYRGGVNILSPQFPPNDYNGHGTHVAGIIAGSASQLGLMGVAPKTEIYAVKAFNRKGSANLSDLLNAINWCIENKMQVINMSFGMDKMSEVLRVAIQTAHQKGIVMVAASGNRGLSSIDFPARYPETIAVTSVGFHDQVSVFSNRGKGIDIAAPGEKIPSAWLNNSIREMSGTSMAVPHVSGTVSLLLYLKRHLNPEQVRYLLTQSADKNAGNHPKIVNAYQAVKMLLR